MRSVAWLAGLGASGVLALAGAIDGCSSASDHPPVLSGTGFDSGHGSSGAGSSSGGSGSSSGGGPACLAGPDGGCTDLRLCGAKVDFNAAPGAFPTAQGGTIVPGTYNLTRVDVYGTESGWEQQTMRLTLMAGPDGGAPDGATADGGAAEGGEDGAATEAGGADGSTLDAASDGPADSGVPGQTFVWESISVTDIAPLATVSGTVFNTDATDLAFASSCPSATSSAFGYTASATTLLIFVQSSTNPGLVYTYTKQ